MVDVDKPSRPMRLGYLLKAERPVLILAAALSGVSVALVIAGPQLLGDATNILFAGTVSAQLPAGETKAQVVAGLRVHGQGDLASLYAAMDLHPGTGVNFTHLGQVLGMAALAYIFSSVFSCGQGFIMAGIAVRVVRRMRQAVAVKLSRLPLQYFDSHPHGDILSRVSNDIDNIFTTLQEGIGQLTGLPPLTRSLQPFLGVGECFVCRVLDELGLKGRDDPADVALCPPVVP